MNASLALALPLTGWALLCAGLVQAQLRRFASGVTPRFAVLFVLAMGSVALPLFCRAPADAATRAIALVMLTTAGLGDARTGYIFDAATIPAAGLCLAMTIGIHHVAPALAALAGITAPLGLAALLSRGVWIGWGDVKASFSLAIAFGLYESGVALFAASITGLMQAALRNSRSIPLGPHLAAGALLATVCGPELHRIIEAAP